MASASAVLSAFIRHSARSAFAAVPAVIRADYGVNLPELQPDCRKAATLIVASYPFASICTSGHEISKPCCLPACQCNLKRKPFPCIDSSVEILEAELMPC